MISEIIDIQDKQFVNLAVQHWLPVRRLAVEYYTLFSVDKVGLQSLYAFPRIAV